MSKELTDKHLRLEDGLHALFEPKSIAVIGASRRPEAVGFAVLKNLISGGFKGKLYPINPKTAEIEGRTCYKSISEVSDSIDLAVIIVPAPCAKEALLECVQKKVKAVIVISAGFREVGQAGREIEDELVAIAEENDIAMLGPNCLGAINTDPAISINASFSRTMARPGHIAFISQSGALCTAILDYAKGTNVGFSKFVSLGNKASLDEESILRYLGNDPQTKVIMMYVEDLVNGWRFIETARKITGDAEIKKPILIIKSGKTPEGAKAASSHTGSMMENDEVYDAIFEQAGVLRVESVADLFDFGLAFASQPAPKSNRVAIVTNAGGPGIMTTDACIRYGLELSKLSEETQRRLKTFLPVTASVNNPIDVIGDAQLDRYEKTLEVLNEDADIDSIIIILTPQSMTDIQGTAQVITEFSKKSTKTLFSCLMGIYDVSKGVEILEKAGLPNYRFPESAARALGAMARYGEWINRPRTQVKEFQVQKEAAGDQIQKALQEDKTFLPIDESMKLMKHYGFPVLPFATADSEEEAVAAAKKIGYPVAMKVCSADIVHKFDVGGVKLQLQTDEQLRQAYCQIMTSLAQNAPESRDRKVFIQKMGEKGVEVILGMQRDLHFGPILMFGLGGIFTEVLKDVSFRMAPIRELGANRMIRSIRSFPILKGVRGGKQVDLAAIEEALCRLSQLSCDFSEIESIDLNPILVYEDGKACAVADARVILKKSEEKK
jgi:acetyl coenzyme A synthetase (ADP forming)-like protein